MIPVTTTAASREFGGESGSHEFANGRSLVTVYTARSLVHPPSPAIGPCLFPGSPPGSRLTGPSSRPRAAPSPVDPCPGAVPPPSRSPGRCGHDPHRPRRRGRRSSRLPRSTSRSSRASPTATRCGSRSRSHAHRRVLRGDGHGPSSGGHPPLMSRKSLGPRKSTQAPEVTRNSEVTRASWTLRPLNTRGPEHSGPWSHSGFRKALGALEYSAHRDPRLHVVRGSGRCPAAAAASGERHPPGRRARPGTTADKAKRRASTDSRYSARRRTVSHRRATRRPVRHRNPPPRTHRGRAGNGAARTPPDRPRRSVRQAAAVGLRAAHHDQCVDH